MEKKKIQNYYIFSLILPLLPIFMLTGPFLPDLTIVITSIFFLIFFKKKIISTIREENILKFFVFFWIIMIISSIFSDDPIYSLRSSFFYIRFIIFSVAIFYLIKDNPKIIEKFFLFIKISLFILCMASLFELISGFNIFLDKKPSFRLTGTFGDEQIVGSFISKIVPLFLALNFYLNKNLSFQTLFLIIICSIVTVLSGDRTAIFFIFVFSFYILFIWPDLNLKKRFILGIIIFFTFFSTIFLVKDVKKRLIDLTLSQFGIFILNSQDSDIKLKDYKIDAEENGYSLFSRSHEIHIMTAINIFKSRVIIGAGPKMFRKNCSNPEIYISSDSCTTHPHNILAQILGELGLIGLIFYITAILYLIKEFFITLRNRLLLEKKLFTSKLCLIFIFSQNLFFLLPAGNFLNNFMAAQMFLPLGFYIYVNRKIASNNISNITNN
jgi:O-antigen ligase